MKIAPIKIARTAPPRISVMASRKPSHAITPLIKVAIRPPYKTM